MIGGGQIGSNWAVDFLRAGFDVCLIDTDATREDAVILHVAEQQRLLTSDADSWGDLSFRTRIEDLLEVDVVVECVPERLELKQEVIAGLDSLLDPQTPIFSSCSGTFRTHQMVGKATKAPGRVMVAHPFHPVHLCPLVSIVKSPETTEELATWAVDFYRGMGKYAMETQDNVGYVSNRLQEALWREAVHMLDNDMATPEQIDAAVVYGFGLRYAVQGPLMTYHLSAADGMDGFLRHFGVTQDSPYSFLDSPAYTPELKRKLIEGCKRMAHGRNVRLLGTMARTLTQNASHSNSLHPDSSLHLADADQ